MSVAVVHPRFYDALTRFLPDTCTITPSVPLGQIPVPAIVACMAADRDLGTEGGGGNRMTRDIDRTFVVSRTATVAVGDMVDWSGDAESDQVADVEAPGTFGAVRYLHCIKVS